MTTRETEELHALCYAIAAHDAAVDLGNVTGDPDWRDQARFKHTARAGLFIAMYDALMQARRIGGPIDQRHQATPGGNPWPIPYDRGKLIGTLIAHQRIRDEWRDCSCGWTDIGASHAEHVASMYEDSTIEETH